MMRRRLFPFAALSVISRSYTYNLTRAAHTTAMTKSQVHVAIVGGGLGGLAAAIGIARAGHKASLLEQAAVLGEV